MPFKSVHLNANSNIIRISYPYIQDFWIFLQFSAVSRLYSFRKGEIIVLSQGKEQLRAQAKFNIWRPHPTKNNI